MRVRLCVNRRAASQKLASSQVFARRNGLVQPGLLTKRAAPVGGSDTRLGGGSFVARWVPKGPTWEGPRAIDTMAR